MSDLFRIALGQMTVAETGTENLAKAVSLMKLSAPYARTYQGTC